MFFRAHLQISAAAALRRFLAANTDGFLIPPKI